MLRAHQDDKDPLLDFLNFVPRSWSEASHQGRLFIFDAFISHATIDVDRSRTLSNDLAARGLRIWHDDEQRMDDARWALRLMSALRNSRFVIVVAAPDSDLLRRRWVPIECKSAVSSETSLPGVPRLLVGLTTPDAPVPGEFAGCKKIDLQTQLDELVAVLRKGNRLPPLGRAPSTMSLAEAQTIVQSLSPLALAPPKENPSSDFKSSKQGVLHALMTSVNNALAETEADPTSPSYGLYTVWSLSQLKLDESMSNDDVRWLISVLEALTTVGHIESRANACFGLRGLAAWGASAAVIALQRVVVRAEDEDIVQLVAEWFGRTAGLNWASLAAEDCARVLLLLPLTNVKLREVLFTRLPPALRVVALPGIVAQATQRAFDQLTSVARVDEIQARSVELFRSGRAWDWEVYFRDLAAFVGVDLPLAHYEPMPLPERVDTYLLLVCKFALNQLECGSNMIWRMLYKQAILMPLAKLSIHDLYRDRAMMAYSAVLDAMEAPVRQDLDAPRREPVQTLRELEQAARLFLIEAFRRGPYFEQMEHGIYVSLSSLQDMVELMRRAETVQRSGSHDDTDTVQDVWTGVDLY